MRVPGRAALRPLLPLPLLPLLLLQLAAAMPRCGAPTESAVPSAQQFAVVLSGSPKTYVPNQLYRVSVEGRREGDVRRKFMGFVLTVEAEEDGVGRNKPVGRFQLYPDALAKFDERCANTVTHANLLPSAEVAINWLAPPEGSGCVVFRAAVQENSHKWYADELMGDSLTQKVCEDRQENMDEQSEINPKCCACEEAKYEVTFEGLWSRHTHPKDFPADSWVTRFSDVIGASHDIEYRFWEYNGQASEGLRQVAERGTTRALETELKAQSEHIRTIIKARGISYPNVTGKTFAVFRVDQKNHLMSLVSMIDPSPDWIVGVSGLELCLANCSWVDHVQLNLYPFDAGTDSGITYIAPDQPTVPQEPIRKMSSSFPNNEASPFFDSSGEPMKPMARLSLVRQRLYEKTCELSGGQAMPEDVDSESNYREGCEVGDWEPWPECPVTCGRGMRHRQRFYVNAELATERGCKRALTSRQQCSSPGLKQCPSLGVGFGYRDAESDPDCELTPWSAWSSCSSSCGMGTRTRSRRYKHRSAGAGKRCSIARNAPALQQNEPCFAQDAAGGVGGDSDACAANKAAGGSSGEPASGCVLSDWSQWSVCSASCGKGQQTRTRMPPTQTTDEDSEHFFLAGETPKAGPCKGVKTREHVVCMAEAPSCHLSPEQAREVCRLPADPGPCRGHLQRWFYHADSQVCHAFEYGGCRGNRNNYATLAECERVCGGTKDSLMADRQDALEKYGVRVSGAITYSVGKDFVHKSQRHHNAHQHHHNKHHATTTARPATASTSSDQFGGMQPVSYLRGTPDGWAGQGGQDGGYGGYGGYGGGQGGGPAAQTLSTVVTGVQGDVVDCRMSDWSRWGPCDATCGVAHRTKQRTILVHPQNGGRACEKKLLITKRCTRIPPCAGSLVRAEEGPGEDADSAWGGYPLADNDCVMSEWSEWSRCTTTCGINAQQIRSRKILRDPGPGGRQCGPRSEVRSCMLLPCPR